MSDYNQLCCCSQKLILKGEYLVCPSNVCIFLIHICDTCKEPAEILLTKEDNVKNHDKLYWKHCNKFICFVDDSTMKYFKQNVDEGFICNLIRYKEFYMFKHILFRYTILAKINVESCINILKTRYLISYGQDLTHDFFTEWDKVAMNSNQQSSSYLTSHQHMISNSLNHFVLNQASSPSFQQGMHTTSSQMENPLTTNAFSQITPQNLNIIENSNSPLRIIGASNTLSNYFLNQASSPSFQQSTHTSSSQVDNQIAPQNFITNSSTANSLFMIQTSSPSFKQGHTTSSQMDNDNPLTTNIFSQNIPQNLITIENPSMDNLDNPLTTNAFSHNSSNSNLGQSINIHFNQIEECLNMFKKEHERIKADYKQTKKEIQKDYQQTKSEIKKDFEQTKKCMKELFKENLLNLNTNMIDIKKDVADIGTVMGTVKDNLNSIIDNFGLLKVDSNSVEELGLHKANSKRKRITEDDEIKSKSKRNKERVNSKNTEEKGLRFSARIAKKNQK
jgi:hypothetical protein